MKLCSLCHIQEPRPNNSWCKECAKIYGKNYRSNNKQHIQELNKAWRQNNKEKCKNDSYARYATIKGRIQYMIKAARKRAYKKNLEFDIDIPWLTEKFDQQNNKCILTGIEFIIPTTRQSVHPYTPSLDRIDISKGYTKDNTRLICYSINCALNTFGEEVFSAIANAYINRTDYSFGIIESFKYNTIKQLQDKQYSESYKGTLTRLIASARGNAKAKAIDFNLSKDFLDKMFNDQNYSCKITGIRFDLKHYTNKLANPLRPSIDRIDCSKGYTEDNVRLVCVIVNFALNSFGEQVFKNICSSYLTTKLNPHLQ